jgi:hypothetical protein
VQFTDLTTDPIPLLSEQYSTYYTLVVVEIRENKFPTRHAFMLSLSSMKPQGQCSTATKLNPFASSPMVLLPFFNFTNQ